LTLKDQTLQLQKSDVAVPSKEKKFNPKDGNFKEYTNGASCMRFEPLNGF
jgi:hypothetical protein